VLPENHAKSMNLVRLRRREFLGKKEGKKPWSAMVV
jgi:hypothetical protein